MFLTYFSDEVKNSIYLGICFVLLFSAIFGISNIQKTLTHSIEMDNPLYKADAYIINGVLYTAFSITMWASPGIVAKIGPKLSMISATFLYGFYLSSYYFEDNLIIYLGACLAGTGSAIIWTGQANYIVLNSGLGKVYKQIGIFWILYQSSHFFGNLILYFELNDINKPLDVWMRKKIVTIYLTLILTGMICLFFLKAPARAKDTRRSRSALKEILKCCKISVTKHMTILCITIAACGAHMTFLSILSATMGFTRYLSENSKELAPLCGLFEGIGEIIGGLLCSTVGGKKICGLKPILTIGCLGNICSYAIVLLALPQSALNSYTKDLPVLVLPIGFLLAASALVGMGDACYHTELYDHLGAFYPDDSASVFAVFKFFRSVAAASSFYCAKYVPLHFQAIILMMMCLSSLLSYHYLVYFSKRVETSKSEIEIVAQKSELNT